MRTALVLGMAILSSMSSPLTAAQAASNWASADHMRLRLVPDVAELKSGDNTEIKVGIEIELAKDWHMYWRTPGESGLAPDFNWTGSENIQSREVLWPAPHRYEEAGLQTFGYADHVVFPVKVKRSDVKAASKLHLKASILVCNNICVPQEVEADLSLPVGATTKPSPEKAIIEKAMDRVPKTESKSLSLGTAVLGKDAIIITVRSTKPLDNADMFIETPNAALVGKPEIKADAKSQKPSLFMIKSNTKDSLMSGMSGKIVKVTVTNGDDAVEKDFSF